MDTSAGVRDVSAGGQRWPESLMGPGSSEDTEPMEDQERGWGVYYTRVP